MSLTAQSNQDSEFLLLVDSKNNQTKNQAEKIVPNTGQAS